MIPEISIIVPVYNTGEVLHKTVESILCQTFTNFELILVDDGSKDGSGLICDTYAKKDRRITVIHKENGGICEARNVGIDSARAKYITFCDHDDIYMPTILEREYEAITNQNVDIVIVGKMIEKEGKKAEQSLSGFFNKGQIRHSILQILESKVINNVWNVLYKQELIHDIRFDENLKYGEEDYKFNFQVIRKVNTAFFIKDTLYKHIVRKNLSTSARQHKELIPALIETNNDVDRLISEMISQDDINKEKYINVQGRYLQTCLSYSMKVGVSYNDFCSIKNQLNYRKLKGKTDIRKTDFKCFLTYALLKNGWIKALYWLNKVYYVRGRD